MNESEAKAALRAQGIRNPSRQLIEDYMRIQQAQEWALEVPERSVELAGERSQTAPPSALPNSAPERTERPHPSSESNLAPMLRERGQLERPASRRKRGRPRIIASFFPKLAVAMSDGTPLRTALAGCGIHGITAREIRSLYRNSELKAMRREARQKWLREWGVAPKARRHYACKGGEPLGMSPQMRRML